MLKFTYFIFTAERNHMLELYLRHITNEKKVEIKNSVYWSLGPSTRKMVKQTKHESAVSNFFKIPLFIILIISVYRTKVLAQYFLAIVLKCFQRHLLVKDLQKPTIKSTQHINFWKHLPKYIVLYLVKNSHQTEIYRHFFQLHSAGIYMLI